MAQGAPAQGTAMQRGHFETMGAAALAQRPDAQTMARPAAGMNAGLKPEAPSRPLQQPPASQEGPFIAPPPIDPGRHAQAAPSAQDVRRAAPPRAAAPAPATRAPAERPRAPSLFERVTGVRRAAPPAAAAPVQEPTFRPAPVAQAPQAVDVPMPPVQQQAAPQPITPPQLGPVDPADRPTAGVPQATGDDLLDIPAFLRRQSS